MSYAVSPSMSDDERDIDIESDVSNYQIFLKITFATGSETYIFW